MLQKHRVGTGKQPMCQSVLTNVNKSKSIWDMGSVEIVLLDICFDLIYHFGHSYFLGDRPCLSHNCLLSGDINVSKIEMLTAEKHLHPLPKFLEVSCQGKRLTAGFWVKDFPSQNCVEWWGVLGACLSHAGWVIGRGPFGIWAFCKGNLHSCTWDRLYLYGKHNLLPDTL